MKNVTTQHEQAPVRTGTPVIRIMRVLPVTIPMPLRVEPKISSGTRPTRPGVRVAMGGSIRAGGFGARLIYRRVERGTSLPIEEASSQRIALLHNRSLAIQSLAFDRAEAGPSDLWIQYLSGSGSPIAAPARLGRCDEGPFDLSPELPLDLFVDTAVLKAGSFDLDPASSFTLSGEVAIRSGVTARLMISEGDQPEDRPIEAYGAIDIPLIPDNTIVQLPRRPLRTDLGRDSWMFLAFLDGTGHVMGGESLLGRAQPDLAMTQHGWGPSSTSSREWAALARRAS